MGAAATRRCELLLDAARLAGERDDGAGEREERVREDGLPASAPSAAIDSARRGWAGEARSVRLVGEARSVRRVQISFEVPRRLSVGRRESTVDLLTDLLTAGAARRATGGWLPNDSRYI